MVSGNLEYQPGKRFLEIQDYLGNSLAKFFVVSENGGFLAFNPDLTELQEDDLKNLMMAMLAEDIDYIPHPILHELVGPDHPYYLEAAKDFTDLKPIAGVPVITAIRKT